MWLYICLLYTSICVPVWMIFAILLQVNDIWVHLISPISLSYLNDYIMELFRTEQVGDAGQQNRVSYVS